MKTAQDWLKDDSDDDEEEQVPRPAPTKTPPQQSPTTFSKDTFLQQKKALQERMEKTLGKETVEAIVTPTTTQPGGFDKVDPAEASATLGPKATGILPAKVHPPAGVSPMKKGEHGRRGSQTAPGQSLKDKIKSVFDSFTSEDTNARDQTALPALAGDMDLPKPQQDMEEIIVMVADRGTQTLTDTSCQTDPDMHSMSCPMCYTSYFGHPPLVDGCVHTTEMPPWLPFQPSRWDVGIYHRGMAPMPTNSSVRSSGSSVAAYQMQIDAIQQQINSIISRHNLPKMPM